MFRIEHSSGYFEIDLDNILPCTKSKMETLTSAIDMIIDYDSRLSKVKELAAYITSKIDFAQAARDRAADNKHNADVAEWNTIIKKYLADYEILVKKYGIEPKTDKDAALKWKSGTFYRQIIDKTENKRTYTKTDGKVITIDDYTFGMFKDDKRKVYTIIETSTGLSIGNIEKQKESIPYIKGMIEQINKVFADDRVNDSINALKEYKKENGIEEVQKDVKRVKRDNATTNTASTKKVESEKAADDKEKEKGSETMKKEKTSTKKSATKKSTKTATKAKKSTSTKAAAKATEKTAETAAEKKDVYQIVTDKIIESLEQGVIPWDKPWNGGKGAYNRITKKPYSYLNQMLLSHSGEYATFKQWSEMGGKIKKGAKAEIVTFWKQLPITEKIKDDTAEETAETIKNKIIPFLRYYKVFHISQVENIEPLEEYKVENIQEHELIDTAEKIKDGYIKKSGITFIHEKGDKAFFRPSQDLVVVPEVSQFKTINGYYGTLFHELTHSTGTKSRLDRGLEKTAAFGSTSYSKEELVAEIGSSFILNSIGIATDDTEKNTTAYLQSWIRALRNDKKLIVSAASKAEKAANYIIDKEPEKAI